MVKCLIHIKRVRPLRWSRHTQPKFRSEIPHNILIACCSCPMGLVNNNRVKLIPPEFRKDLLLRHHLHSREKIIHIIVFWIAWKQTERPGISKHFLIAGNGLLRNLLPVYQKQHFLRIFLPKRKSRSISLSRSGRWNQQRLRLTCCPDLFKIGNKT